jgi:hypothetical protein
MDVSGGRRSCAEAGTATMPDQKPVRSRRNCPKFRHFIGQGLRRRWVMPISPSNWPASDSQEGWAASSGLFLDRHKAYIRLMLNHDDPSQVQRYRLTCLDITNKQFLWGRRHFQDSREISFAVLSG